jgi:hypothetical protein
MDQTDLQRGDVTGDASLRHWFWTTTAIPRRSFLRYLHGGD